MLYETVKGKHRTSSGWISPPECCEWEGCAEKADYPAPVSPAQTDEYSWFCLEHVRAYNQQWNYYRHATPADIERHYQGRLTGNRPTWSVLDYQRIVEGLCDAAREWGWHSDKEAASTAFRLKIPAEVTHALTVMKLSYPTSGNEIKARYKQLAKLYHPDLNRHPSAHAQFTSLQTSYQILLNHPFLQINS